MGKTAESSLVESTSISDCGEWNLKAAAGGEDAQEAGGRAAGGGGGDFHLPANVVKIVASLLIKDAGQPKVALLHLASMCCVCRGWRAVACRVSADFPIVLDSGDSGFERDRALTRFTTSSSANKVAFFCGMLGLLKGYTKVVLSGDCITDTLLIQLSRCARDSLKSVTIRSTRSVTDKGLTCLVLLCNSIEHFHLEDIKCCEGHLGVFLSLLLKTSRELKVLHLERVHKIQLSAPEMNVRKWGAVKLENLHVTGLGGDFQLDWILQNVPALRELDLDGPPENIEEAVVCCEDLVSLSYIVTSTTYASCALLYLQKATKLRCLGLLVKSCTLTPEQLCVAGMLPVTALKIDCFTFKSQFGAVRSITSHIDNAGVKSLVDGVCHRAAEEKHEHRPLTLSLCGAATLTHEAVSALLRLPLLVGLDVTGCSRITAMDKMRLVAKVKAGKVMQMKDRGASPQRAY